MIYDFMDAYVSCETHKSLNHDLQQIGDYLPTAYKIHPIKTHVLILSNVWNKLYAVYKMLTNQTFL